MKRNLFFSLFLLPALLLLSGCGSSLTVDKLLCNNQLSPVGVEGKPVFRWTLTARGDDARVTAFEIKIEKEEGGRKKEEVSWRTGKVVMGDQVWIEYSGPELEPATAYEWQVRVWDQDDKPAAWSRESRFVTGIPDDQWSGARWIGYESMPDSLRLVPGVHGSGDQLGDYLAVHRPVVPQFRKMVAVDRKVEEAFLFVSGLGHYTLTIDGKQPGNRFLAPGWTHYAKTCFYNGYEITPILGQGDHAVGITVGNGFFNINRERYRKLVTAWGMPMMRMILVIRYADGTSERIVSDETWKAAPSPITYTSIYGGEDYDARLEQPGWDKPGFDDSGWQAALSVRGPGGIMRC
ncbi:MAG: alpha-L-rhamnosidase N-terminal domain-containing protein, partial [Bacteroidota bacterium]